MHPPSSQYINWHTEPFFFDKLDIDLPPGVTLDSADNISIPETIDSQYIPFAAAYEFCIGQVAGRAVGVIAAGQSGSQPNLGDLAALFTTSERQRYGAAITPCIKALLRRTRIAPGYSGSGIFAQLAQDQQDQCTKDHNAFLIDDTEFSLCSSKGISAYQHRYYEARKFTFDPYIFNIEQNQESLPAECYNGGECVASRKIIGEQQLAAFHQMLDNEESKVLMQYGNASQAGAIAGNQ